jgi:cytochrome c oxidase subunit 2
MLEFRFPVIRSSGILLSAQNAFRAPAALRPSGEIAMHNGLLLARENVSIFDPVSPPASSIRDLSVLVFFIIGLIFVLVEGVLFYCIYRYRHRKGTTEAAEPPQVYGSQPIEIAWTAAPGLVVFILLLVTTRTLWEVNPPPPEPKADDNVLYVTVVGKQWWWEFNYTHYNGQKLTALSNGQQVPLITANELHIPASEDGTDRTVWLTLESADVCHSFWVPRLAGKTDLIPGRTNKMWFRTKEKGLFVGQCAEYCGSQHANMLLRVVVESPEDFDKWLSHQKKEVDQEMTDDKKVFLMQSCVNCHRVRGTPADGNYGPDLTHLMSRDMLASGMIPNDKEGTNLDRWVDDPQKIKPSCLMPAFKLSDKERKSVVRYLRTLR